MRDLTRPKLKDKALNGPDCPLRGRPANDNSVTNDQPKPRDVGLYQMVTGRHARQKMSTNAFQVSVKSSPRNHH